MIKKKIRIKMVLLNDDNLKSPSLSKSVGVLPVLAG